MHGTAWVKSPGNAAEWSKPPRSKGHTQPGSIYMTFSKRQSHSDREQCQLLPRGLGLSCVTIKDAERQSGDNEAIPCWDGDYKNVSVLQFIKRRTVITLFYKCTCTCVRATTGLWKLKGAGSFPSTMWVPRISQVLQVAMTALLPELKPKSHTSYTFFMLFLLRFDIFLWAHYKCVARKSRLSHTLYLDSSSKLLD